MDEVAEAELAVQLRLGVAVEPFTQQRAGQGLGVGEATGTGERPHADAGAGPRRVWPTDVEGHVEQVERCRRIVVDQFDAARCSHTTASASPGRAPRA